ncbi:hypothetical protein MKW98_015021 [Papaver atlanticum]|uniref:Replication protein A OB domain-containing protein n=1 Tax=Papaver atlanticum TaxID=357466 RepID=A0AAD4S6Y3_9MAGN|nr:hypothetical protein MKW98_015021 [Papaver atlanticum]
MFRPSQNDYRAYFNRNTDVTPLESATAPIPRHKFFFTEFEALAAAATNTYLTDVVGVLTSHTNLQQLKRGSGDACFMSELTLKNISGMKLKVTLWGDSTSELTRNLEAHELNPKPIVAVVAGSYAKKYLANDFIFEQVSHRTPPREITLPARVGYYQANQSISATKKTIFELQETKWESGYNVLNKKICSAKAIGISIDKGWYYLGCHNCTTKLVGNIWDHWCPSCKVQIDEPVPRFCSFYQSELLPEPTGATFFVAMDTEVDGFAMVQAAFEPLVGVFQDYLIMINPYNMKCRDTPSFTVAKLPSLPPAPTPTISVQNTVIIRTEDEAVTDNEQPTKKPRLQKMPEGSSASTIAQE